MEIVERLLAANNPNRQGAIADYGARLNALGLEVHTTANPGANALDHFTWLQKYVAACFHFCSDWDRVMAFLPWRPGEAQPAWHSLGNGNRRFLSWELCETADPVRFERSWELGAQGQAEVLRVYGQDADWLVSHGQITRWFPEDHGDHTDPRPYFAKWGRSWVDWLYAVDKAQRGPVKPPQPQPADWKAQTLERAYQAGVLSDLHQPGEPVEMEELAGMGLRLHGRITTLEALVKELRGVNPA